MYLDLKQIYWSDGMKKDVREYMAKCPNFEHVKAKHLKPGGLTQMIEVLKWKWESINMVFVVGLSKTRRQHDSIWVIVEKMTMSANFIPEVYLQSRVLCETLH